MHNITRNGRITAKNQTTRPPLQQSPQPILPNPSPWNKVANEPEPNDRENATAAPLHSAVQRSNRQKEQTERIAYGRERRNRNFSGVRMSVDSGTFRR
jgi:hypothetical protein